MAVELPVLPSGSHFTETGAGTGLIRQFDWRHRKPNVIITNWGRKVFFSFPKERDICLLWDQTSKSLSFKDPGKWTFYSIIRKLQKQNERVCCDIPICVCSRVWLSFLLSAAGENNEGGVQVPRREWILRAQDLLALPRFISPGE